MSKRWSISAGAHFKPRKHWLLKPAAKRFQRFRDRHWPAFAREKRMVWRRSRPYGFALRAQSRLLERTCWLAEARGWLPYIDLTDAHYMRACDAMARRMRWGERIPGPTR